MTSRNRRKSPRTLLDNRTKITSRALNRDADVSPPRGGVGAVRGENGLLKGHRRRRDGSREERGRHTGVHAEGGSRTHKDSHAVGEWGRAKCQ